ncbi:GNAT family N-acetyltransferase [Actinomadura rubrisoli]|uniref:N-acetyltransferase n=1 Tax=Actinomadura rubrisoli TaxID=2530368 RepID=A0A4R5A4F2_9ACTN|nr:GNAT family protein [Actinomadura rubrisoli]TDD66395.1 N-acetyltransferase [Actinomadura rubrisoli]
MKADQIELRPVAEDDLAVIERLHFQPEAAGPFVWAGWNDPGGVRRRWSETGLLGEEQGDLMVVRGAEPLGYVSYRTVATGPRTSCWSIGVALLPEARGRGAGTRAQRLLVSYLFAHTQANRVQAETEVDNIAEQRALEKAGFTREGVMRGYGFRDGRFRDAVLYGIVRHDVLRDGPL